MKRNVIVFLLAFALCASFAQEKKTLDVLNYGQVVQAGLSDLDSGKALADQAAAAYAGKKLVDARNLYLAALSKATVPEWYYALGEVAFDLAEYWWSEKAFSMAGYLRIYEGRPGPREDFSFYNAACAASLRKNEYGSLTNLEWALARGYSYKDHLLTDPDIEYLRGLPGFRILMERYFPPELIAGDASLPPFLDRGVKRYVLDDLDGDARDELALLFHFEDSWAGEGVGSYYLAYYEKDGAGWTLVNRTKSRFRSAPEIPRNGWASRVMKLELPENPLTLSSIELDGRPGKEIIVPGIGNTYYALKVFSVSDARLQELGEVEGFELFFPYEGRTILAGHFVTDTATLDGKSKDYFWYSIEGAELVRHDAVPDPLFAELEKRKWNDLKTNRSVYHFAELFWFQYMNRPGSVDGGLLEKMASFVYPAEKENLRKHLAAFMALVPKK